ncbi:MAG: chromosomal replication initiator protein DnaA [Bacteroidales bacterium]|nr:chromosomal replication initiator protein DnaA [Bacteroidales bacterium]
MQLDHTQLWEKCLEIIRDNISAQQFSAWFSPIKSYSFSNKELRLIVPTSFYVEHIEELYLNLLKSAVDKVYGTGVKLFYCYTTVQNESASGVEVRSAEYSPIIKNNGVEPANPYKAPDPKPFDSQLNPRYNFENYCSGSSNSIARTIAESIANDPSNKTFNPLFIFGPTGVGKTHLIQAVGIRIKEQNPRARVLYVTARLFQSQYTAAIHKGQINNFFHFYQSIDTLIVDDVQDLAGKAETQNTFFHIFNQLHQNNRQIILSSDCPPSEMDGFEARLLSRFKWGASAQLEKPDMDLRRRVLIKKAEQDGLSLPADVIDYIAENVTDSIRELEGVVVSLVAHATVLNREITIDLARPVVANAIRIRRSQVNFEMVTQAVCDYFKIEADTLFTKSRKREISDARQIVMYMAKKHVNMSYKTIGTKLGRTHATVIYACRNIDERIPIDKDLRDAIDSINRSIGS